MLIGSLPVLLAGCSETWSLAATESGGNAVLHLPPCTTRSVAVVRLVDESTYERIWEIAAAEPVKGIREFVVGEPIPGFDVVVPLTAELAEGVRYSAEVRFGDSPGPFADVRFTTGDLSSDSWWFEDHVGTQKAFELAAQDSGLCGGSAFSLERIFWTKFGLGCLIVVLIELGGVLWLRRRSFGRHALRRRPPPGWYRKWSDGKDTLRWWDGRRWTRHITRRTGE